MYNNESTESKISRKRNRSDSEKNDPGFDQSTQISTDRELFFEKPTLKKNQYFKHSIGKAIQQSDEKKCIKNSLSLPFPDEVNYDLINYSVYNKDKCSCNYFKELFNNYGQYITAPVFICNHIKIEE